MALFDQNADIAAEFEYWIENKTFMVDNPISIEGYTAKALAEKSEYLEGEGAFIMLIELRNDPKKALATISNGLKRK